MASSRAVTVGTSPTLLSQSKKAVVIDNRSTQTVFVGGSNVSATTGFGVDASQKMVVDFSYASAISVGALYGVVASGTADVRVLEFD